SVVTSTEGAGQQVTGTTTDLASNPATTAATLNIDRTSPNVHTTLVPSPNAFGWNNTGVTVSFTCSDALSGVASCPSSQTVSTEGANQNIAGTATDLAGNTAAGSTSVNVDKTPPVIALHPPMLTTVS